MKIIVFWFKISLKYVTQGPTEVKIGLAYGLLPNRQKPLPESMLILTCFLVASMS